MTTTILLTFILILVALTGILVFAGWRKSGNQQDPFIRLETRWIDLAQQLNALNESRLHDQRALAELKAQIQQELTIYRQQFDQHQMASLKTLQESLQQGMYAVRQQLSETLNTNTELLNQRVAKL